MDLNLASGKVTIDEDALQRVERAGFEGEGASLAVSVVVVGDEESRRVNHAHLGHDYETDVIAFDLTGDQVEPGPEGEIYVNADLAAREALERGHDPFSELAFYVAHGLLHLLGYDDASDAERAHLHSLQRRYLEVAGVVPPASDDDD